MRILEANVDDIGLGGVYSLVRNVIINKNNDDIVDIASYEPFERQASIDELVSYGSSVHYVGYLGNKIVKQFRIFSNMKRLVKYGNYDAVHIHSDVANKMLVLGLAAKAGGACRIIMHSHASSVDGQRRWLKSLFHRTCRLFLPMIGTDYMSCSDLATKWMFPHVDASRVRMLNNGVDLRKFAYNEEMRQQVRGELGISNELLVGHVGRFAYQKNHEYLLRVFAKLKNVRQDAWLLLVGVGELRDAMRTLAGELGIAESVIFYGASPRVCDLFQAMDVFVLPSHFEGLPIVGVEAQAAGLPVVFSSEITREAKILDNVSFVGIDADSEEAWVNEICSVSSVGRRESQTEMEASGFSIASTVATLMSFYHKND